MLVINNANKETKISEYLGRHYSLLQSIIRGGTGSAKIVYTDGLKEFDAVAHQNSDTNYCNFQILKEGFVIRFIKKNTAVFLVIKFSEVEKVVFITTPVKVRVRGGTVIRYKANLIVKLVSESIHFEVLVSFYNAFKRFLTKNFKQSNIEFRMQPSETDEGSTLVDILGRFVK